MIERLTQQQKEDLLRDYFAGGMSAAAEQEFFVHVALDDDLRQMLKAHSIVRSTLEQGHAIPSVDHHDARARMIASLAARHPSRPGETVEPDRPAWRSITGFLGAAALVAIVATTMVSKENADESQPDTTGMARVVATTELLPTAVADGSSDTVHAMEEGRPRPREAVKQVATESSAHLSDPARSGRIEAATASKETAHHVGSPDTTAPVALKPASNPQSATADTIREKSRDTMTFRLRVRKVEE